MRIGLGQLLSAGSRTPHLNGNAHVAFKKVAWRQSCTHPIPARWHTGTAEQHWFARAYPHRGVLHRLTRPVAAGQRPHAAVLRRMLHTCPCDRAK